MPSNFKLTNIKKSKLKHIKPGCDPAEVKSCFVPLSEISSGRHGSACTEFVLLVTSSCDTFLVAKQLTMYFCVWVGASV